MKTQPPTSGKTTTPRYRAVKWQFKANRQYWTVECQPDNPVCQCYSRRTAQRIAKALNTSPQKGRK